MDIDFIIAFESGEASEKEIIENFQKGIDDGSVWSLQGFYGRTAKALIDQGLCHFANNPTKDYYGNSLPVACEQCQEIIEHGHILELDGDYLTFCSQSCKEGFLEELKH